MTLQMHFLFVTLCCLFASQTASSQYDEYSDTLKQGDFLNSSTLLYSANSRFSLGFYIPNPDQGPLYIYYLAIWYYNYGTERPVWIGKRNKYIVSESYAVLSLDNFANLVIQGNGSGDSFNIYSSGRQTSLNATATLLDTGNFVLRESNSDGSVGKLLWQSFDYPTDTLLPGMKLGLNHRTGLDSKLTSWFDDTRPENGAFSLEWDPTKQRLVATRRGVITWTSGSLKDGEFEFIFREKDKNANYEFISETNEDEDYFAINSTYGGVPRWFLDYDGTIYNQTNNRVIASLDDCYGTKKKSADIIYVKGCESWEQPACRNSYQKFDLRSGMFRESSGDESLGSFNQKYNTSISDCREECWRDCNCAGYSFGDHSCFKWSGTNVKFEQDNKGESAVKHVLISEAPPSKKKSKKWIPIVIVVVVSLATFVFCLLCYLKRKIRQGKEKELRELMTLDGFTDTVVLEKDGKKGQNLKFFSHSCIVTATNSFSAENKLGEGGFGPVYKGKLPEGKEIAVKRLSKSSGQGLHEFKTELLLIAKLQHTNLVRLFGCCIHGDEKMLIYEYMPNKSLDFFLFDETSSRELSWERRFIIIEGIAQGLLYLHKYSRLRIVHRDLKASNILLDENMNPRISDFGTARIFKKNLCEESTMKITGTRGYMAPEYLMEGTFSVKSDVFSFGVLMLEIVSGRKNNSFCDVEGPLNLAAYAWELWNRNSAVQLMDAALLSSSEKHDQVLRCIHIGLLCVQHSPTLRPKIAIK